MRRLACRLCCSQTLKTYFHSSKPIYITYTSVDPAHNVIFRVKFRNNLSQCLRFLTMWYVRPAKPQIRLRIRAVWSDPLLVVEYHMIVKLLTEHHLEFLSLKGRLQRLVWVYTCQNATLLEITCLGSFNKIGSFQVTLPLAIVLSLSALAYGRPSVSQFCRVIRSLSEKNLRFNPFLPYGISSIINWNKSITNLRVLWYYLT